MATFKAEVIGSQKKLDGTWNVKIRITHNRKVRRVSTPWYVTKEQMTKGYKIKDQRLLATLDETIRKYRERLTAIGISADGMDIDILIPKITTEESEDGIGFFEWADRFVASKSSPGVYRNALNSFRNFTGSKEVYFQEITGKDIRAWMQSMPDKTARNLVPRLKHIFESGKSEFNDEDTGRFLIPNNPFAKITLPKEEPVRQRAVIVEVIRMVAMIPDEKRINSALNITRDMFLVSFCLIGMNAADIYDMKDCLKDGVISYERKKTRNKRVDRAFIRVNVPACVMPIVEKYKGATRTFNVYRRYSDELVFDNTLAKGMEKVRYEVLRIYRMLHPHDRRTDGAIATDLNIEPFNFYAARHSWATIARNDMGRDKWMVHEALNHVDKDTKIDDVYIMKDFRNINEANAKVMDYVFGIFTKTADEILAYIRVASLLAGADKSR